MLRHPLENINPQRATPTIIGFFRCTSAGMAGRAEVIS
jgi:hypothetical protein